MSEETGAGRRWTLSDAEDRLEAQIRSGGKGPITEDDVRAAALIEAARRPTGAIVPSHQITPRAYLVMCGSVRRAMDLMAELDSLRTPADRERVQHGVSHELESLAKMLDMPAPRGRHADVVLVDDVPPEQSAVPLPFDAAARSAEMCGRPDCIAAGGRRFGCTC